MQTTAKLAELAVAFGPVQGEEEEAHCPYHCEQRKCLGSDAFLSVSEEQEMKILHPKNKEPPADAASVRVVWDVDVTLLKTRFFDVPFGSVPWTSHSE